MGYLSVGVSAIRQLYNAVAPEPPTGAEAPAPTVLGRSGGECGFYRALDWRLPGPGRFTPPRTRRAYKAVKLPGTELVKPE